VIPAGHHALIGIFRGFAFGDFGSFTSSTPFVRRAAMASRS
jgi:hypothetical protein